jgi:hypothetical protein
MALYLVVDTTRIYFGEVTFTVD